MSDSALIAVQAALVAQLRAAPGLAALRGVYDAPPPQAAYPFIAFGERQTRDWSHSAAPGREVRLSLCVCDDGESPARLLALIAASEAAVDALPRDLPDWRIASVALLASQIVPSPPRAAQGVIDYRFRLVSTQFQN